MRDRALELKGLALLLVFALLTWLSVATYQKKFVDTVDITLHASRAGLQLNTNGDVRMRGALVGRISGIDQRGGEAVIHLALDRDQADKIPADVRARILPTTLFGQKYVELVSATLASGADQIESGAVIGEDTSAAAVELTAALDHLEPVLTALRPQDLSTTLQAVAEGLDGLGEQLGRTVTAAAQLLTKLESHLPTLTRDLQLLAQVTTEYAAITPDLLRILANTTVTATTVVDQKAALATFYTEVTGLSDTLRAFLDRNGDGIVEAGRVSRPVLALLARYAPELPCVLRGLVMSNRAFDSAFRNGKLHSYATLGLQYPAYKASDTPGWAASAPGPTCAGLPSVGRVTMPQFADGGAHPLGQVVVP